MRIDYTDFLRNRPKETNVSRIRRMKEALVAELRRRDIHGRIDCAYYADGTIRVSVDGAYYNIFNSVTGRFFQGYVGD